MFVRFSGKRGTELATRFIDSVVPLVNMISFVDLAFKNLAQDSLVFSSSAVAFSAISWAAL